ncbi:MAG TPA: hypothetical protein VGD65_01030, partial [Chryseosolibacter sp.]
FFMDEATAFAAGHRPCFECRREDAKRFKECWLKGNPSHQFSMSTSISLIDEVIHHERVDAYKQKVVHHRPLSEIADGTFLMLNSNAYLFLRGNVHRWTPSGYAERFPVPNESSLDVLTPNSIVNAFAAGYVPQCSII